MAMLAASCTGNEPGGQSDPGTASGVVVEERAPAGDGLSPSPTTTTTLPTIHLVGKVVDAEGGPVPGAVVTVGGSSVTTAADGWFDLATTVVEPVTVTKPAWVSAEVDWNGDSGFLTVPIEPFVVRGLRVGGGAAGSDEAFAGILDLAASTAINTLVFDTKQEGGKVMYDTRVEEAHASGAVDVLYDPVERIAQAKEAGLYTITRIVTFEDWFFAQANPGGAFNSQWLNPADQSNWEYPLALAEEACELGFDEIQFDYVRFPSGETASSTGQLDMTQEERVGAIESFLARARAILHPMGCAVSADIFGIVVSTPNDQGIGQRPEELTRQLDAISPMVYPSHYSDGWRGFAVPNDHPYDVTAGSIEDALPRLDEGTILRPWLQAFWWTNDQIRRSIQAAEDRGLGWILWNARSNFSASAIPTDAEVS